MCGILGAVVHDGAQPLRATLLNGLRAVEYRGYDSSGVAVLGEGGLIVTKRLTVRGFIVSDFAEQNDKALSDLQGWVASGELKVQEDVIDGFENLPAALVGLLHGENRGKRMVRV